MRKHERKQKTTKQATITIASDDLIYRYRRGFGLDNLQRFRLLYIAYPPDQIYATLSRISFLDKSTKKSSTPSRNFVSSVLPKKTSGPFSLNSIAACFPLPWSVYVRLLSVKNEYAHQFYETEALRGGWLVRQLDRQINSQFYERTALSNNKAAMLARGQKALPKEKLIAEELKKMQKLF